MRWIAPRVLERTARSRPSRERQSVMAMTVMLFIAVCAPRQSASAWMVPRAGISALGRRSIQSSNLGSTGARYAAAGVASDARVLPASLGAAAIACAAVATLRVLQSMSRASRVSTAASPSTTQLFQGRKACSSNCIVAMAAAEDGTVADARSDQTPTDDAVARTVIQPLYRSIPQAKPSKVNRQEPLQVLVLSEANICRSPVAEVMLRAELDRAGLGGIVGCASKAVHDYALGEGIPEGVREACTARGLPGIASDHKATLWNPEWDVCDYDLLVAVDRYVAADAMKEVSVWDTIQKEVEYCTKVRGLYEFGETGSDIVDPLYGNRGGDEERAALESTFDTLQVAIAGLVARLQLALGGSEAPSREEAVQALGGMLHDMGDFEWDAPPMLRKRSAPAETDLTDGLVSIDG